MNLTPNTILLIKGICKDIVFTGMSKENILIKVNQSILLSNNSKDIFTILVYELYAKLSDEDFKTLKQDKDHELKKEEYNTLENDIYTLINEMQQYIKEEHLSTSWALNVLFMKVYPSDILYLKDIIANPKKNIFLYINIIHTLAEAYGEYIPYETLAQKYNKSYSSLCIINEGILLKKGTLNDFLDLNNQLKVIITEIEKFHLLSKPDSSEQKSINNKISSFSIFKTSNFSGFPYSIRYGNEKDNELDAYYEIKEILSMLA